MAGKAVSVVLRTYKGLLQQYPFGSQCAQCGVLMGSGDLIAQTVVERKKFRDINFERTAFFASLGVVLVGPALTTWYRFLERRIGNKGTTVAFKKVTVDQLLFAPTLNAVLLPTLAFYRTRSVEQSKEAFKNDYLDVLMANYKLWPGVQLCNFYFVPLQYQVLVVQCVALVWNTYLSWKTQKQHVIQH